MEGDAFLERRFKIFGLLMDGDTAVEVSQYSDAVEEEKRLQKQLHSSAYPELPPDEEAPVASSKSKSNHKTKTKTKQEKEKTTKEEEPPVVVEALETAQAAEEITKQQSLGGGSKTMVRLLPCFQKVTVETEDFTDSVRYILKVNYDEHQYKTIVISTSTSSISVCALLASKLMLNRFTFRLFALKDDNELHCIGPSECVSEFLEKMIENCSTTPNIRLIVLRPPPSGNNPHMRKTVITRWLNYKLKGQHVIKSLKSDLASGEVLCSLAETLSKKRVKKQEGPSKKSPSVLLLTSALELLESIGIVLHHKAIEQIQSGKLDVICQILWNIIFRYAVTQKSLGSANQKKSAPVSELIFVEELFDWCNTVTSVAGYESVALTDFNRSWRDGLAFAAILEQYDNYRVSFSSILAITDVTERLKSLFFALEKWFGLPAIITPDDLLQKPEDIDDMSIILFLTVATLHLHSKKDGKSKRSSSISNVGGKAGTFPYRIFVEGLEGISNKAILLPHSGLAGEFRILICRKMRLTGDSFWIYITENGEEKYVDDQTVICLTDGASLTIKMVSGSSIYNASNIAVEEGSKGSKGSKPKRRSSLISGLVRKNKKK